MIVKSPKVEIDPRAPPNVIVPVPAVKERELDPSTVLVKAMEPDPEPEEIVVLPVKLIGSVNVIF